MVLQMGALQHCLVRPFGPDHGRAVHVLADLPQCRVGRLRVENLANAGVLPEPGCALASPSRENTATHVSQDYVRNWTRACRHRRDRAGSRPAADQPAADRLRAVRADLPEPGQRHRPLRPRVVPDQRHAAELDRPDRRAEPAGAGDPAAIRPVLPRGHGQHRRHPGPWLAEHRHTVAAERPGESPEWSVLPVGCPCPDRRQGACDPDIDIVMAAIYGGVTITDTKLLATAALLRSRWADQASKYFYPISGADQ
jgi:hypothetical protein